MGQGKAKLSGCRRTYFHIGKCKANQECPHNEVELTIDNEISHDLPICIDSPTHFLWFQKAVSLQHRLLLYSTEPSVINQKQTKTTH